MRDGHHRSSPLFKDHPSRGARVLAPRAQGCGRLLLLAPQGRLLLRHAAGHKDRPSGDTVSASVLRIECLHSEMKI